MVHADDGRFLSLYALRYQRCSAVWRGLLTALAVGLAVGCGGEAKPPSGLSVLLVTLDTTRADVLGCYGGTDAETPNLNRLAEEGVRFDRCTACTPLTLPSHSTILTGTWPTVHGVRANGSARLPESAVTVAEVLEEHGLSTRAVVASFVLKRQFGLAQGFEVFDQTMPLAAPRQPALERPADLVAEAAIHQLREVDGRRFFLWVHFYDPHYPYVSTTGHAPDSREAYMEEIGLVDRQLGRILRVIDALGMADSTAVVVVGDHGEGLGDHGEFDHGFFLYETTQHVPLIVKVPGWTASGEVVSTRVRTVDVAPTLLQLVGVAPPATMEGESLVPMLADPSTGEDRSAYGEAWQAHDAFGMAVLRSLHHGRWKLVDAPDPLLFDLATDPGETNNLAQVQADRVAAMRRVLRQLIGESDEERTGALLEVTDQMAEALDALGYTAASSDSELTRDSGNPLDHKGAIEKYGLATRLMIEDPGRAMRLLKDVILTYPEAPGPFFRQMRLLMSGPDGDQRIDFCREVLVARPEAMLPRLHLAQLLVRGGQIDAGLGELELLLVEVPNYAPGHLEKGKLLLGLGDIEAARFHLEAARRLAPHDVSVLVAVARMHAAEGDMESAEEVLVSASAIAPDSPAVNAELARLRRATDGS